MNQNKLEISSVLSKQQRDSFLNIVKGYSREEIITKVRRNHYYLKFHQEEKKNMELMEILVNEAWNRGIPLSYVIGDTSILVDDMTEWEVRYVLRDLLIDNGLLS